MKRLLVHVGYHKTGSSWLQRELFGRTDRGFFPLAPRRGGDPMDPRAFARRLLWAHALEFDPAPLRNEVLENTDGSRPGCPVVSHERLSGNPHSGGYDSKELADRLRATFPEAAILIVIREQVSAILSCYHQYLKVGGACSLDDYVSKGDGIRPSFSLAHFRYNGLVGYYQCLFGRENVLVLPYEMLCESPARFTDRLARFARTTVPPDLPFELRHNVSRGRFVATKTRWLNLFACRNSLNGFSPLAPERTRPVVQAMRRRLDRLVPRALEESCERRQRGRIARLTEGCFGESNRITSDLIGIDLSAFGYAVARAADDPGTVAPAGAESERRAVTGARP